jgi:hypothetical protein
MTLLRHPERWENTFVAYFVGDAAVSMKKEMSLRFGDQ